MGNYEATFSYDVDLVFCIDATGSMDPLIDMVKRNALNFYDDLVRVMEKNPQGMPKRLDSVRIRVIAFRDYLADGANAMLTTDFFTMPEQAENFKACVNSIRADGGGDEPEDGLEALAYAIRSPWMKPTQGRKRRQVIVVWTDASTHSIGYGAKSSYYPKDMVKDFVELTEWWESGEFVDKQSKRLLLFAPDKEAWSTLSTNWDNVVHHPARAGEGLQEIEYEEMLNLIRNSIGGQ